MSRPDVFLGTIDGGTPVVATDNGRGRALCVTEDKHWTMTREWENVEDRVRLIPEDHPLFGIRTPVHNHGTEEGPGLACREHTLTDGTLLGECMIPTLTEDRDWWTKAAQDRALELAQERVEARSSVSKADIQRVVNRWWEGRGDQQELEDDLWELHKGTDRAVYVVRESDIAAVEVRREGSVLYAGDWVVRTDMYVEEEWRDKADRYWRSLAETEAVIRAIEDGQADPVEEKARELWETGRGPSVHIEFDDIAPDHRGEYLRLARHVLGQEASSDE